MAGKTEFATYKDLMNLYEKINTDAKADRHYIANQISKFTYDIDGKMDELKDKLPNMAVTNEKIHHLEI